MEKAFDPKDLVARLKAKGLDAAEDVVKIVAGETMDWAVESLVMHENQYVKFFAPVLGGLKPVVMAELDKIDGKVG